MKIWSSVTSGPEMGSGAQRDSGRALAKPVPLQIIAKDWLTWELCHSHARCHLAVGEIMFFADSNSLKLACGKLFCTAVISSSG